MKKCYKHHNNLYILTAKQTFFSSVSCHRTLPNDFGKLYEAVHYFFGLPKAGLLFFFVEMLWSSAALRKKGVTCGVKCNWMFHCK